MGLFDFIGNIFKPATDLVDNLHTSEQEKLELRNELVKIQSETSMKLMELQKTSIEAQAKVQSAEAASSHWIAANWRPMSSLSIVILIIMGSFGWVTIGPDLYDLAKIFLGSYSIGRTAEKIGPLLKIGK